MSDLPEAPTPDLSSRRGVLKAIGLGALATPLAFVAAAQRIPEADLAPAGPLTETRPLLRPPRLRPGATIGLVAPAGRLDSERQVDDTRQELDRLGFLTKVGRHVMERHGYLAGTDEERAADIMEMFLDREVDAILALRGGWGCARILPLLDYDEIRAHPKALIGYSDITALLLAIYARSGIVTFHGPVGRSNWNTRTVEAFRSVLVRGERLRLDPVQSDDDDEPRSRRDPIRPIRAGIAEGPLVGGNLSVVSALIGTPYMPSFENHIVFFEEVREQLYRVDRLLTQFMLAGSFEKAAAIVFGQCARCTTGDAGAGGLTWLLRDHLHALRKPAWTGAPIGHVSPVYTLPIGISVVTDSALGTLHMLEPAVI
ncbi:MAG: LD-carboxypeptidase [Rubricoccaceae bacterium]|nr:LD-carboxypeptidase [Rubricoccaceae bacterium]